MNRQHMALRTVVAALLAIAATAGAQSAPAQDAATPLEVTATDSGIEAPESVEAGFYTLGLDDRSGLDLDLGIGRIEEGATLEEVLAAVDAVNAAFMGQGDPGAAMARVDELTSLVGGQGTPEDAVFELTPGEYFLLSVGVTEEGQSHTELGLYTTLTVTEAAAEASAPQADLTVDMLDFAFSIPDEVPAGEQTWEVVNVGEQVHHMELLRVREGRTMEDVMAFLQTEEGEPPADPVGYVTILDTDERNFVTLDLEPGTYVALCFMPDYETGMPHVALGMVDGFTVAAE